MQVGYLELGAWVMVWDSISIKSTDQPTSQLDESLRGGANWSPRQGWGRSSLWVLGNKNPSSSRWGQSGRWAGS